MFAATADYFALCDMRTVAKLQFHLKYNGRAPSYFEKVFSLCRINYIIRHYHVCAWSLFWLHSHVVRQRIYIHSVACSHARIISFTNLKWNSNGFELFPHFSLLYEPTESYTIHNNYVYWFLYGIHSLQNVLVSCKLICICHCHMFCTKINQ